MSGTPRPHTPQTWIRPVHRDHRYWRFRQPSRSSTAFSSSGCAKVKPASASRAGTARRPVRASAGSVRNSTAPARTAQAGVGGAAGRRRTRRRICISSALRTGFGDVTWTTPSRPPAGPCPSSACTATLSQSSAWIQLHHCRPEAIRPPSPQRTRPARRSMAGVSRSKHNARPQDDRAVGVHALRGGLPGLGDVRHLRRFVRERGLLGQHRFMGVAVDGQRARLQPHGYRRIKRGRSRSQGTGRAHPRARQQSDVARGRPAVHQLTGEVDDGAACELLRPRADRAAVPPDQWYDEARGARLRTTTSCPRAASAPHRLRPNTPDPPARTTYTSAGYG